MMTPPTDTVGPDVRLYRGDAMAVLAGMDDASVDAVVTDPPFGVRDEDWDAMTPHEFARFTMGWLSEARRVAGELVVFGTGYGPLRSLCEMLWPRVRVMVWNKPAGSQYAGATERGVWFAHETIYHCHSGELLKDRHTADLLRTARKKAELSLGALDIAIRGSFVYKPVHYPPVYGHRPLVYGHESPRRARSSRRAKYASPHPTAKPTPPPGQCPPPIDRRAGTCRTEHHGGYRAHDDRVHRPVLFWWGLDAEHAPILPRPPAGGKGQGPRAADRIADGWRFGEAHFLSAGVPSDNRKRNRPGYRTRSWCTARQRGGDDGIVPGRARAPVPRAHRPVRGRAG